MNIVQKILAPGWTRDAVASLVLGLKRSIQDIVTIIFPGFSTVIEDPQ
jgi:hypothetical protein